jgi:hypothetical protein
LVIAVYKKLEETYEEAGGVEPQGERWTTIPWSPDLGVKLGLGRSLKFDLHVLAGGLFSEPMAQQKRNIIKPVRDRPVITTAMIKAAEKVLHESGALDAPTSGDRLLVQEMLEVAFSVYLRDALKLEAAGTKANPPKKRKGGRFYERG